MLSLDAGQWQMADAWWVMGLLAVTGGLGGLFSTRLAGAYVACLARGACPDPATFRRALLTALGLSDVTWKEGHRQGGSGTAWRWPIAFLMAGVAPLLCWRVGLSVYFTALLIAAIALWTLALIDAACGVLPDVLTLPLLWLGLASSWAGYGPDLPDALAGVMLAYCVPGALLFVYKCASQRDGMGQGDLKLLAGLGAWLGWQAIAPVLFLASVGLVAFAAWHQKSWKPVGSYSFGPFLIVSAAGVFVGGPEVHSWFI